MQKYIFVIKKSNFGAASKPLKTIQRGNFFVCPQCSQNVPITYYENSRGKYPDVNLQCPKCKSIYGILL